MYLALDITSLAQWLSWLERRPVTAEVMGSSPIRVALFRSISERNFILRGLSSAGRASALQAEGHRFEPYRPHMDGFPSGQRGQTVNLLSTTSVVRIHPHPVVLRGLSSAGRASALQAEGHRFEPCRPHLSTKTQFVYKPMWLNWQSS